MFTALKISIMPLLIGTTIALLSGCTQPEKPAASATSTPKKGVTVMPWGMSDGKPVSLYTLTNAAGMVVKISDYGGTITSWIIAGADSTSNNIVLGFDSLAGYLAKPPYFGATVGRYGNRIAKGRFSIGKNIYTLATNDGKNSLHGGLKGFDKQVWTAGPLIDSIPTLSISYLSRDGEEGYPGNLQVTVTYTLSDAGALTIDYSATTDKPTPVNITNHSYFNLGGRADQTILGEKLQINADRYTPVDSTLIPTGALASVRGTPFDFTMPAVIGSRIAQVPGGYDHNFVLNKTNSNGPAAILRDTATGRMLTVYTTEPGLQFYTGNFLNGTLNSRDGRKIAMHDALCMETQHFPNSPNEPSFPTTILQPGQTMHSRTTYLFSIEKKTP